MADLDLRLRRARASAAGLIERYGIEAAEHIRLEDIAWDLGIEVVEAELNGSVARLVWIGDRALVRVSTAVGNAGRRRFSVAHETGHYVFKHADHHWLQCAEGAFHDFGGHKLSEAEANVFASELLLPSKLIQRKCEACPVNLKPIISLAEEFSTSVTSAAIRFVELSPEACALVFSHRGTISWIQKSKSFWPYLKGRGEQLDPYSVACDYFAKGKIHDRAEQVDGTAWIAGKAPDEIWEHSMAIPSINSVLTVLWLRAQ